MRTLLRTMFAHEHFLSIGLKLASARQEGVGNVATKAQHAAATAECVQYQHLTLCAAVCTLTQRGLTGAEPVMPQNACHLRRQLFSGRWWFRWWGPAPRWVRRVCCDRLRYHWPRNGYDFQFTAIRRTYGHSVIAILKTFWRWLA